MKRKEGGNCWWLDFHICHLWWAAFVAGWLVVGTGERLWGLKRQGGVVACPYMEVYTGWQNGAIVSGPPATARPEVSVWQHRFKWGRDSQSHRETQSVSESKEEERERSVFGAASGGQWQKFWMVATFVTNATIVVPLRVSPRWYPIRTPFLPDGPCHFNRVQIIFRIYNATRMDWSMLWPNWKSCWSPADSVSMFQLRSG